jgi:DNA-binding NtrC family response regulator
VTEFIGRVAKGDSTVLIRGESGTGKELVARAIHRNSPRASKPFVAVNCAAFTETLLESELFGHEKGAFTSADRARQGLFEAAHQGTLFLDEVAEMSPAAQAKLLRVVTDGQVLRLGSTQPRKVDVRLLAATHRDLAQRVSEGLFRQDLYYRLAVVPIAILPLRERREDIAVLSELFVRQVSMELKLPRRTLMPQALDKLKSYDFPGNIRELRNLIERLVILTPDDEIGVEDVKTCLPGGTAPKVTGLYRPGVPFRVLSDEAERTILEGALAHHQGQMAATARALGLERSHLYKKARALGLRGKGDDESEPAD